MRKHTFDPDVTRRDDGPYWAAALALALKSRDELRIKIARHNLARLGYPIGVLKLRRGKKEEAAHE